MMANRSRQRARKGAAALALLGVLAVPTVAGASGSTDARVTDQTYVSSGTAGYNDALLHECSVSRGRKNEPAIAVDPRNSNVMLGSSNDYCGVFQDDADGVPQPVGPIWLGYYRTQNGGSSWTDSLVPGYPGDSSAAAVNLSHIRSTTLGDPVVAWDTHGRAFFGSIGDQSDISKKAEGDINISVYNNPGGPSGATSADGTRFVGSFTVQQGTPSPLFLGHFNDKVWMDVDRTGGSFDGNVYVTWTRFEGIGGTNQLFFSRSTDHGHTWSHAVKLTESAQSLQGSDIAITKNGDVYVSFVNDHWKSDRQDAARYVKSTNGGKTWSPIRTAAVFEAYDASDQGVAGAADARELADQPDAVDEAEAGTARDCGDDFDACLSGFTFFRHDSSPRIAADQSAQGNAGTVYIVFHATKPGTEVATGNTFGVMGPGNGGQAGAYIVKTTDGGAHWSAPALIAPESSGHQIWPVVDANRGVLRVAWYDSRNDRCYSPARPIGNCADGTTVASLDTFSRTSSNGGASWGAVTRLSSVTSNPNYEMFDGRRVPFWGDYIDLSAGGDRAFAVWTDGRDIVPGTDLRFPDDDNADVKQCRSGDLSVDFCPRAGGLDQNIYGSLVP
jgi:hypothetical protein